MGSLVGKNPAAATRASVQNLNLDVLREIPLDEGWSSIGLEGADVNEAVCQYQVVILDGLEPATTYQPVFAG